MTETNRTPVDDAEKRVMTVRWRKMTDGIGLVFAGVLCMLEALDPKTAKDILDHYSTAAAGQADESEKENAEKTGTETVDSDTAVDDPAVMVEETQSAPNETSAAPSVTQDDITKIIVQKLKKDRTNNEKIGAILKTYGVAKVSELPAEKYEAFLTDLSQL